jgi:hypothetical protein
VPSDGQRSQGPLSQGEAARIAQAFELTPAQVLEDAAVVADWPDDEAALQHFLQHHHQWDTTVAPFYVLWLRGDGTDITD